MKNCGCRSAGHELGCFPLPEVRALYKKYDVTRTDGRSQPGERHFLCNYFVLDLTHDMHTRPALLAYAESCRKLNPELSRDLFALADGLLETNYTDE